MTNAPIVPVVRLAGIEKRFAQRIDHDPRVDGNRPRDRGRRVRVAHRPIRLRQVDAAAIIGDLTTPSSGTAQVNGKPAPRARLDRDYGMVFQAPLLFDWRTVENNVQLPLELLGEDRPTRQARAREMLELVDLSDFARHHPYQLSGGMQQRVAIARALAISPSLLLMDEPFGALDEMTRERMNAELLSIWERTGITVVFVTHSIPEAVFLSSRVAVMSARPGRITHLIDVDLPRPRGLATRESPRYFELITQVREALRAGEPDGRESLPASAERVAAEGEIG